MSALRLPQPLFARARLTGWVPVWSLPALLRAIRATVVVCGLFALTDR